MSAPVGARGPPVCMSGVQSGKDTVRRGLSASVLLTRGRVTLPRVGLFCAPQGFQQHPGLCPLDRGLSFILQGTWEDYEVIALQAINLSKREGRVLLQNRVLSQVCSLSPPPR